MKKIIVLVLVLFSFVVGRSQDNPVSIFYIDIVDSEPPETSAPVANFTASTTSVTEGQSINFTDTSTNTPTSWSWTFEGGSPATSGLQNRSVSFATAGTYTITLTASNEDGSDVETKTNYITVTGAANPSTDLLAQLTINDGIVSETNSGSFTVSLNRANDTGNNVTIPLVWSGAATVGVDYVTPVSSVTIPNGQQSATITITPINDNEIEIAESIMARIVDGTNYDLGNNIMDFIQISDTDDDENGTFAAASGTGNITNSSDFTNAANAGKTMTVTGTFSATGLTAANGMVLVAGGGVISGTNINLNGSFIQNDLAQIFSASARFSALYVGSRISPEVFGAISGDAIDDNDSIDALLINSAHSKAALNGTYIKNHPSTYTRGGEIDFDLNGATISVTSNANMPNTTFNTGYLFRFDDTSPKFYNGNIRMNNVYGRCFYLYPADSQYYFADLDVRDLYEADHVRAIVWRIIIPNGDFALGEMYRNVVDNVESETDGIFNNTLGLSKAIWIVTDELSAAQFYYFDNNFSHMNGDDAEHVYIQGGREGLAEHWFNRENYTFARRRQMKATTSRVSLRNSYFQAPNEAQEFSGQAAVMVGIFGSIGSGASTIVNDIEVVNCDFVSTGVNTQSGYSSTEINNLTFVRNRVTYTNIINYP